ncbi:hypothetical protein VTK26DRAFT_5145 [Humicola hyalothermophila]
MDASPANSTICVHNWEAGRGRGPLHRAYGANPDMISLEYCSIVIQMDGALNPQCTCCFAELANGASTLDGVDPVEARVGTFMT